MHHCHPELVLIASRALRLSEVDFSVTETLRSRERQATLFEQGHSRTLNSKHLADEHGLANALDVAAWVDGEISWQWEHYEQIALAFDAAADELGLRVRWGGTFRTLKDGAHFERVMD